MGGSIRNNSGNNQNYTEEKWPQAAALCQSSEDEIEEDSAHLADGQ